MENVVKSFKSQLSNKFGVEDAFKDNEGFEMYNDIKNYIN